MSFQQLSVLHTKFEARGFSVLAFPSNDFHQELESNNAIQEFIKDEFPSTNFPVFGMSSLADNPVYKQLRKQLPDDGVRHNFFKYLVDRKGIARQLFPKARDPLTLEHDIELLLAEDR